MRLLRGAEGRVGAQDSSVHSYTTGEQEGRAHITFARDAAFVVVHTENDDQAKH